MFFVMILAEWVIMLIRDNLLASSTKTSTNGGDKDKSSSWPLAGYRLNDAIASITLGSYQLVGLLMVELAGIGVERHSYTFVYENLRLFTVDSKANVMFSYVCLFLGKDLAYYWAHRMMHEWHAMWIGHSVHHR
jgi:sterol desaturase/sphingolipid hydroxylase (fatty acid hydroxylase superfamily)